MGSGPDGLPLEFGVVGCIHDITFKKDGRGPEKSETMG